MDEVQVALGARITGKFMKKSSAVQRRSLINPDRACLGLIISHFIRCRARGVRVVAVGVSPNVMQLFKFTRTDSLIPTAASVEDALAAPRS